MEFERFCRCEPQNLANWPAEFGRICRGKLWALVISNFVDRLVHG